MIALGNRPGLICKGTQPVDVYVGGHPVTPGITLEDYPLQEASGSVVTIEPLTGYKLGVTSHITAVQEGTGDPSPDNVRPIVGWDSVTLTYNDQANTRALPETVYGGTLDWRTGLLTVTHVLRTFDGSETWSNASEMESHKRYYTMTGHNTVGNEDYDAVICNRYATNERANIDAVGCCLSGQAPTSLFNLVLPKDVYADANDVKSLVQAYADTGEPLAACIKLRAPYTIQLTPQQLVALAGTNTIYSNSGDTTVTYRIRKT